MPEINLYPENNPGGYRGDSLQHVADSLSFAVEPLVTASDQAALAAVEAGEYPEVDPRVAALVQGLETIVNKIAADFEWAAEGLDLGRGLMDRVTEMSAEEFAAVKDGLIELAPNFDWQGYYTRNYKRDPGRFGKLFRPVLRFMNVEPPYWR